MKAWRLSLKTAATLRFSLVRVKLEFSRSKLEVYPD